jgi:two-component system copper resistance phosphate regulon response regulator CusR
MYNRLLIVDDEPDIATPIKKALETAGYQVDVFTDPTEALAHFKQNHYDLLLLDIRMPHLNGFQLSRELVKLDAKPKVCFMTAFEVNIEESKRVFPNLKVDGFMRKPIRIKELVKAIQSALNPPADDMKA